MRNIAHVITGLDTGGAETMLYRLLRGTDRARWKPSVVSLRDHGTLGASIEQLGIPIRTVEVRGGVPTPFDVIRLRRQLTALNPALIQGWMYHGNLAATTDQVLRRISTPVLWNIRYTPNNMASEKPLTAMAIRVGAWLSSRPVRIIYNSHTSARLHAELGYATDRTSVIPNGFDVDQLAPSEELRQAFRKRLGVPATRLLIGRVGRYHAMKDYETFLQAGRLLVRDGLDVRFVLVGKGLDGENTELRALLDSLSMGDFVKLLGEVLPAGGVIASLDLMCSSSSYGESFPTVLGEAMACGVPCVATDVGDSAWIIGKAGLIVPPKDPEAMAAACRIILGLDEPARRAIGEQGRDRIVSHFSLKRVIQQYESVYENVLHS